MDCGDGLAWMYGCFCRLVLHWLICVVLVFAIAIILGFVVHVDSVGTSCACACGYMLVLLVGFSWIASFGLVWLLMAWYFGVYVVAVTWLLSAGFADCAALVLLGWCLAVACLFWVCLVTGAGAYLLVVVVGLLAGCCGMVYLVRVAGLVNWRVIVAATANSVGVSDSLCCCVWFVIVLIVLLVFDLLLCLFSYLICFWVGCMVVLVCLFWDYGYIVVLAVVLAVVGYGFACLWIGGVIFGSVLVGVGFVGLVQMLPSNLDWWFIGLWFGVGLDCC